MANKPSLVVESTTNETSAVAEQAETPIATSESTDNALTESENASEQETEQTAEAPEQAETPVASAEASGNILVTYIANGVWIDETGKKWCNREIKNTGIIVERLFTEEELANRLDIQFMIKYGSMKTTEV